MLGSKHSQHAEVCLTELWQELNTAIWLWADTTLPPTKYRNSYPIPVHISKCLCTYLDRLCYYLIGLGIPATHSFGGWYSKPLIAISLSEDDRYWGAVSCYVLVSNPDINDVLVKFSSRPYIAVPRSSYYQLYDGIPNLVLILRRVLQCGRCHYSNDTTEYCGLGRDLHIECGSHVERNREYIG